MNIKEFVITAQNKQNAISIIEQLDCSSSKFVMVIRNWKSKRSNEQNSRYWKLITELGKHIGYEPDETHDLMRFKYLKRVDYVLGKPVPILKSTTKLTTAEMAEYQEAIERFGSELGFYFDDGAA